MNAQDLPTPTRPPRRHGPNSTYPLVLAAALVVWSGCSEPPQEQPAAIPRVKVFTVGKKATGQSRRISGKIRAADQAPLSFGVGGKVLEILVAEGQRVTSGQLLASLDPEQLRLALEKARADVTNRRAQLVEARSTYERVNTLAKERGAARKEVDAATAALAAADGELSAAQRSLQHAELDFARVKLTAPFDGQVVAVAVDPFQEVAAAEVAFTVQTAGTLEAEVSVPETLIRDVDFGQVVQVEFPTLDGVAVSGTVATIGAEAEAGNAFPVTVRLAPTEADVRPGMTASVTFNFTAYLGDRTAYLIPLSAIAIEAGLRRAGAPPDQGSGEPTQVPLFVLDPTRRQVALRQVTVGNLRGNDLEVFEGLEPGDQVIVAGVAFLRDGMQALAWTPSQEGSR
ncbi:MAG: efflux RND transporter periplasmic adaptor subunit [Planctomycetota bacterium]